MKYNNIQKAVFQLRPNRFIAECDLEGEIVKAHVRNTGRCRELLVPGCTVYLEKDLSPNRKTQYTLISVEKSDRIINIDSLAPNRVFFEAIELARKSGVTLLAFDCRVVPDEIQLDETVKIVF